MDREIYLEFRTQSRGYTLLLEKDLFGDWIVTRYWYGLKNGRGSTKQQLFPKWKDAFKEIEHIEKIRLRKGYMRL